MKMTALLLNNNNGHEWQSIIILYISEDGEKLSAKTDRGRVDGTLTKRAVEEIAK